MVTFFTEQRGVIAAIARGGRRSQKRFATLEPMHLLRVALDERPGAELAVLDEASIERARVGLVADLARLDAAGRVLRWVRAIAPPRTPEPAAWREVNALLDRLDDPAGLPPGATPASLLAATGMRLLAAFGWALELEQCVTCGRPCDPGASAFVDPARGGLVCRACGGGPFLLRPDRRARLVAASRDEALIPPEDLEAALDLVEGALAAHASGG